MNVKGDIEAFDVNIVCYAKEDAEKINEELNVFPKFEHNCIRIHPVNRGSVQIHNECSDTPDLTECYDNIVKAVNDLDLDYRYISLEIAVRPVNK